MTRRVKSLGSKKKIFIAVAVLALVIVGGGLYRLSQSGDTNQSATVYQTSTVTSGKIASSTLLSGTVSALAEQYVYYDASKGSSATVTVEVGQQIGQGQQLVQYDATSAQANYDIAVRNLNKVGRQINALQTYGTQAAVPTTPVSPEGAEGASNQVVSEQVTGQSYQQQLQDLYDAYADAEAEVQKAQDALNQTVVVSDVDGTVVDVNDTIDPAAKESQALVHVSTQGELQVTGTVTEYDLATLKQGDAVIIKSKVYPDKQWQGKISSISDYPLQSPAAASANSSGTTGAKYEYKVAITSDLGALKQGFTVSVEVVNNRESLLIPTSAVVTAKGKNYVWRYDKLSHKVSKQEVSLGRADANSQEILNGLSKGDRFIANPDKALKEGDKLSKDEVTTEKTPNTNDKETS